MTPALILSDDMLFASRITSGLMIRTPAALLERATAAPPALVFVDLQLAGLKIDAFVAALKQMNPAPRIIAYGSHVDVETLRAARAAGCDEVLPRSAFADRLAACGLAGFRQAASG